MGSSILEPGSHYDGQKGRALFTEIMNDLDSFNTDLFVVLLWQIWFARNELCFEKVYSSPEVCYKRAKDGLMEYHKWNKSVTKKRQRELSKGCKPSKGSVIVNFDASINSQRGCCGLGVIARDDRGRVLMAAAKTQWSLLSAEMAELKALEWVVLLAIHHSWNNILIEEDAHLVIEALTHNKTRGLHSQVLRIILGFFPKVCVVSLSHFVLEKVMR